MKTLFTILILSLIVISCSKNNIKQTDKKEAVKQVIKKENNVKKSDMKDEIKTNIICNNFKCLDKNKNKKTIIEGVFRKYTPDKTGKGANYMFWNWELLLSDGIAIPVIDKNKTIKVASFENKNVSLYGNIFYGVIIGGGGSSIEEQEQSARGYRIDAISLQVKEKKK